MDSRPAPAADLPALYRSILDAVAELELAGERREAGRVRAGAIAAYSRGWDEASRRRLDGLHQRARRLLDPPRRDQTPHEVALRIR